jgi:ion channel-forming bestrophin family protein
MIQYDAHNWTDHLFDIKGSMVHEIIGRVLLVVAWSAAIVGFHYYVRPVSVPSTIHSLVSVALGLLLVFRTNASYDRFWEGRKAWGSMVNTSRNLARATRAFLSERPDLRGRIVLWCICFVYASMNALRGVRGLGPSAARLPAEEVAAVENAQHVPLAAAMQISGAIAEARREGSLSDYLAAMLDNNVQLLVDNLGVCERIHRTPLPFAYVVHLRRALLLYCATLPFALIDPFGWYTVLDTFVVAYIFFGIEEIGVEIEDPFGEDDNDLPLEDLCRTIENNLLETLESGEGASLAVSER